MDPDTELDGPRFASDVAPGVSSIFELRAAGAAVQAHAHAGAQSPAALQSSASLHSGSSAPSGAAAASAHSPAPSAAARAKAQAGMSPVTSGKRLRRASMDADAVASGDDEGASMALAGSARKPVKAARRGGEAAAPITRVMLSESAGIDPTNGALLRTYTPDEEAEIQLAAKAIMENMAARLGQSQAVAEETNGGDAGAYSGDADARGGSDVDADAAAGKRKSDVRRAARFGGVLQSPLLRVLVNGRPLVTPEQLQEIKATLEQFRGKRTYRPWTPVEKLMIIEALEHPLLDDADVRLGKWEFIQVYGWHSAFQTNYRSTVDIRCAVERMVASGEMPPHLVTKLTSAAFMGERRKFPTQRPLKRMVNAATEAVRKLTGQPPHEAVLSAAPATARQVAAAAADDIDVDETNVFEGADVADVEPVARGQRARVSLAPGEVPGHSTRISTVRLVRDHEHISRVAGPSSSFSTTFTVPLSNRLREFIRSALTAAFPGLRVNDGSITYTQPDETVSFTFQLSKLPKNDTRTLSDVHFPTAARVMVRALVVNGVPSSDPAFEQALTEQEFEV